MKRLILPILLFLFSLPLILQLTPLEILKLKTFDTFVSQQKSSGYFTILNITEEDIANEGGYPLSRQTLAQIQINLLRSGAIGVGWVVAFPQPDRFGGDFDFTEALGFSPSVLAMYENNTDTYPPTTGTVILGEDTGGIYSQGVVENIEILKQNASQGLAVARTDVDNLVRRLPLLMRTPDGWVPSYGIEVLKILLLKALCLNLLHL
jgi:CHASE2 domain-containing sensor protein